MDFIFRVLCVWFSLDILIIATSWFLTVTVPSYWPDWWKQVVVLDLDPRDVMTNLNYPDDRNIC